MKWIQGLLAFTFTFTLSIPAAAIEQAQSAHKQPIYHFQTHAQCSMTVPAKVIDLSITLKEYVSEYSSEEHATLPLPAAIDDSTFEKIIECLTIICGTGHESTNAPDAQKYWSDLKSLFDTYSHDSFNQLLRAADYLQAQPLLDALCHYILNTVSSNTYLKQDALGTDSAFKLDPFSLGLVQNSFTTLPAYDFWRALDTPAPISTQSFVDENGQSTIKGLWYDENRACFVVATANGELGQLHDAKTREVLYSFAAIADVKSIFCSPHNRFLIQRAQSGNTTTVDTHNHTSATWQLPNNNRVWLVFSSDGTLVAYSSYANVITILNLENNTIVQTIRSANCLYLYPLGFSADNKLLLAYQHSYPQMLSVFNCMTGTRIITRDCPVLYNSEDSFSYRTHNSKCWISFYNQCQQVDPATTAMTDQLDVSCKAIYGNEVHGFTDWGICHNQKWQAATYSHALDCWPTSSPLKIFKQNRAQQAKIGICERWAFSNDSKQIAAIYMQSNTKNILIWDVESFKLEQRLSLEAMGLLSAAYKARARQTSLAVLDTPCMRSLLDSLSLFIEDIQHYTCLKPNTFKGRCALDWHNYTHKFPLVLSSSIVAAAVTGILAAETVLQYKRAGLIALLNPVKITGSTVTKCGKIAIHVLKKMI